MDSGRHFSKLHLSLRPSFLYLLGNQLSLIGERSQRLPAEGSAGLYLSLAGVPLVLGVLLEPAERTLPRQCHFYD